MTDDSRPKTTITPVPSMRDLLLAEPDRVAPGVHEIVALLAAYVMADEAHLCAREQFERGAIAARWVGAYAVVDEINDAAELRRRAATRLADDFARIRMTPGHDPEAADLVLQAAAMLRARVGRGGKDRP